MKRSITSRVQKRAAYFGGSLVAPLLAAYFFLGPCTAGRRGFVLAFRGWGVSAAAAVCR